MRPPALAVLVLVLVTFSCGGAPKTVARVATSPSTVTGGYLGNLGTAGCSPGASFTMWQGPDGMPETGLDSRRGSVWALFFAPVPPPAGTDVKVVWRMTGTGPWTFTFSDASGASRALDWGPEEHTGSNWDHPGDEVGTGFTFTHVGCWNIHVARADSSADLWLEVGA